MLLARPLLDMYADVAITHPFNLNKERDMPRVKTGVERKAAERRALERSGEYLGICSTCNYAPDCAHRLRNPDLAIWECEDYDDYVHFSGTSVNGGLSEVVPAPAKSRRAEFDAVEYQGLCKNCETRDECTFPRPAGGVWHCEEYQ